MKIGIAGAGIMGQLLAYYLINSGCNVAIFDDGDKDNSSKAAAGLLNPVSELEKNDVVIFQLGEESINQHWPAILKHVNETIYFKQSGSLVIAHAKDRAELTQFMQMIATKLNDKNLYYKKLNQSEIKELEPEIIKFSEAYYFPTEAQLDNQQLLSALEKNLIDQGIIWHKDHFVSAMSPGKIMVGNKTHSFDWVFDCRGLGARIFFKDLRSIRGELIWLKAEDVNISRPVRFLHPRYRLYITPRPEQIYLIGASEIESDSRSAITVRTTLELLSAAYCVNTNFAEATILKTVTNCRPTLLNHLPKIKYTKGLIAINGLYRHGFLIAPALAVEVMRFMKQGLDNLHYPQLWETIYDHHFT